MTLTRTGAAAIALMLVAGTGSAQDTVDPTRLGIDLNRIQKRLQQAQTREERDGFSLKYFLDVYGQAPRLVVFGEDANLVNGPAPYGAPTHQDMLDIMTPQEFRSPVMDFNALMQWLAKKTKPEPR